MQLLFEKSRQTYGSRRLVKALKAEGYDEYSMLKNAAAYGLINEEQAIIESLLAIKRAGADFTISYFAKDIARYLTCG